MHLIYCSILSLQVQNKKGQVLVPFCCIFHGTGDTFTQFTFIFFLLKSLLLQADTMMSEYTNIKYFAKCRVPETSILHCLARLIE